MIQPLEPVYRIFDRLAPFIFWGELAGGVVLAVLALFGVLPSIRVAAAIGFVVLAHQGYDALRADRPEP